MLNILIIYELLLICDEWSAGGFYEAFHCLPTNVVWKLGLYTGCAVFANHKLTSYGT